MAIFQPVQAFLGILFLVVVFKGRESHTANIPRSPSVKDKLSLGCKFEDDKYTLKADKHVFGTAQEPEVFANEEEFVAFLDAATPIYKAVYNHYVTNDIDPLLKFAEDYKSQNSKDLETFHKEYNLPFELVRDPSTMVIEFFNQLIEVQPRVADNLYLVLTQMDQQDIPVLEYSTYAYRSKFIVKEQFNGFVAGALRFDIEGKLGTVIFDPYVGVREIVVIFDDPASITDSPLKGRDISPGGASKRITYRSAANNTLVVALAYYHESPNMSNRIMQKFLYFTGRPYCSFLDTYSKPLLLAWEHNIVIKYQFGSTKANLRLRIKQQEVFNRMRYSLITFNNVNHQANTYNLELRDLDCLQPNEDELNTLFAPIVKLTKDDVVAKLKKYRDLFLKDKKLYEEFYNLNEKKEREDKELGDQCEPVVADLAKIEKCLETSWGAKRVLKQLEKLDGRPLWNDRGVEMYDELVRKLKREVAERKSAALLAG